MPRVGENAHIEQSRRSFRGHARDFQAIKVLRFQLIDRLAGSLFFVGTERVRLNHTGDVEKVPSRLADYLIQSPTVEVLDQSPSRTVRLPFQQYGFWQARAPRDQNCSPVEFVCHCYLLDLAATMLRVR